MAQLFQSYDKAYGEAERARLNLDGTYNVLLQRMQQVANSVDQKRRGVLAFQSDFATRQSEVLQSEALAEVERAVIDLVQIEDITRRQLVALIEQEVQWGLQVRDFRKAMRSRSPAQRKDGLEAFQRVAEAFAAHVNAIQGLVEFLRSWLPRFESRLAELRTTESTASSPPDPWPPEDRND